MCVLSLSLSLNKAGLRTFVLITSSFCKQLLQGREYFGQYGKVLKAALYLERQLDLFNNLQTILLVCKFKRGYCCFLLVFNSLKNCHNSNCISIPDILLTQRRRKRFDVSNMYMVLSWMVVVWGRRTFTSKLILYFVFLLLLCLDITFFNLVMEYHVAGHVLEPLSTVILGWEIWYDQRILIGNWCIGYTYNASWNWFNWDGVLLV